MKLFQRLLVAPAALGLMAPVAANADTAFTSTTTLSGTAVFTVGSVADGGAADTQEELYMQYAYGLDVNSSFTGEDSFYAGLIQGNASGPLADMDSAEAGDLSVTSLFYNFPVGDLSVTVGPLVDQDDVIAATTSIYSDDFRLGAMPFGAAGVETGAGVAVAYSADNGFVASASYISTDGANSEIGIGSDDGDDVSTLSVGYDGEGWGAGLILTSQDGDGTGVNGEYSTFGGGFHYSPESIDATISVTYDTIDMDTLDVEATDLFVGIDYEVGPGTMSVAYNSTDVDGTDDLDTTGFELSYTYDINDNVSITPGFFTVEDVVGDDDTGVVVETVFNF